MAPDGSISDKFGWTDWEQIKNPDVENLIGMDRFEAREAIVEWFREEGLLEEIRPYAHEVGHSYRSHVPIEPYLSDQWYIAVKKPIDHLAQKFGKGLIDGTDVPVNSLAGLALKPLLDSRLKFIPERYAKTYQAWLENLRDWPISRQLWWGHQIPVWKGMPKQLSSFGWQIIPEESDTLRFPMMLEIENVQVPFQMSTEEGKKYFYICVPWGNPDIEKELESMGFVRDMDVLDTWFSSALWPFSTLGWPDESPLLRTFYPGDVLCTAREIITLWVTRMVMMGQYCAGDIPFKDVYIHAMIQDGEGRKMSKSLGNGIDPLVAINSHGADAMRFTLASMTTDTQDIRMPVAQMTLPDGRVENTSPKLDIGRNFCNKLWNASRFAMMNLEGTDQALFDKNKLAMTDKWILSRLARTIAEVTAGLDAYKYNEPLNAIYKFFWNDFCDWYLEWAKPRMSDTSQKPIAQNVLAFVLDQTLRLLHPFVPFITEGIFQKLNELAPRRGLKGIAELNGAKALVIADWPKRIDALINERIEQQIDNIQTVVRSVRDIRSKCNIPPSSKLVVSVNAPQDISGILNADAGLICQIANLKEFNVSHTTQKPKNAAAAIAGQMQIYVHDAIDIVAERKRLTKQKEQIEGAKKGVEAKLANENFIARAKPEVVAQTKEKLTEYTEQLKAVEKHLAELND
jgi:valyl-tRNA synthetase